MKKKYTGKDALADLAKVYGEMNLTSLSRKSGVSRSTLEMWKRNPGSVVYDATRERLNACIAAHPAHSREANGVTVLPQPTGYVGVPSADTEIWRDIIEALRGQREATQAMLQEILDRLPPRQITPERGRETTPGVASARPRKRA